MPKSFINIRELAQALNLSTSTVSRAFRDKNDINAETKQFILDKAKELGYYPNIYASNLRDSKSKTIAVIMPELANNFFSLAVKGIEKVAQANGYHTLIYVTDSSYKKEVGIVEELYNGRVEGIIMSVSGEGAEHNYIEKLRESGIPLVFFDRVYEDIDVPKVTTDDFESSFKATEYFLKEGLKKVAFLVIDKAVSIGNARMQGYIEAHRKCGIPLDRNLIVDCSNDFDTSYEIIFNTIKNYQPEALFASVERLATASYKVCLDNNVVIPEQIKIISYSNLSIADLLNPSLSTITQPAEDLGTRAASLIFDVLKEKPVLTKGLVLQSEIIHRDSTKI
ncbi:MAG TPA: LacI family DNA-binding transcriptional regulator [Arachidicoccus sp.]|nr:LacI family DNA-binding transcriptional regulator [Arachidicoccus sp.]